jgi:hypothetical protein
MLASFARKDTKQMAGRLSENGAVTFCAGNFSVPFSFSANRLPPFPTAGSG